MQMITPLASSKPPVGQAGQQLEVPVVVAGAAGAGRGVQEEVVGRVAQPAADRPQHVVERLSQVCQFLVVRVLEAGRVAARHHPGLEGVAGGEGGEGGVTRARVDHALARELGGDQVAEEARTGAA